MFYISHRNENVISIGLPVYKLGQRPEGSDLLITTNSFSKNKPKLFRQLNIELFKRIFYAIKIGNLAFLDQILFDFVIEPWSTLTDRNTSIPQTFKSNQLIFEFLR